MYDSRYVQLHTHAHCTQMILYMYMYMYIYLTHTHIYNYIYNYMYAYICCRWTCDGKRLQLPCQFPPLIDQRAAGKMRPCKRWSGKICRLLATSHRALWCIVSWKRNLTGFKDSGHDCNLLFISILSQPQQLLERHIVPRCDALVLLDSRCFPPCVPLMRSETVISINPLFT